MPDVIASLPMYDWPEIRGETDRFWQALAEAMGVRGSLLRGRDCSAPWHDQNLLFSQTCGYPFTHGLRGRVRLVATPHYAADGCEGPLYRSMVFAREKKPLEAFRGSRAVVNGFDSMSGMLAVKLVFADLAVSGQFFAETIESGGHIASLQAVQAGRADVCAIDCVCVELARRYRPALLNGLHEIARSPHVPGLPFITVSGDVEKLRDALTTVFSDEGIRETRGRLLLNGFSILKDAAYDVILQRERGVETSGGLVLA